MILLHGTTRQRAELILQRGPDPRYKEPGGLSTGDGFSAYLEVGPFLFGSPDEYALGKSRQFSDEGGPVILIFDVPEDVIQRATADWLPQSQGVVQFDHEFGLEELLAIWPDVARAARIRSVE